MAAMCGLRWHDVLLLGSPCHSPVGPARPRRPDKAEVSAFQARPARCQEPIWWCGEGCKRLKGPPEATFLPRKKKAGTRKSCAGLFSHAVASQNSIAFFESCLMRPGSTSRHGQPAMNVFSHDVCDGGCSDALLASD